MLAVSPGQRGVLDTVLIGGSAAAPGGASAAASGIFSLRQAIVGLPVSEKRKHEGLDLSPHVDRAYNECGAPGSTGADLNMATRGS